MENHDLTYNLDLDLVWWIQYKVKILEVWRKVLDLNVKKWIHQSATTKYFLCILVYVVNSQSLFCSKKINVKC